MGGGFESPRNTGTSGVEELTRGGKTSGVNLEGDWVLGAEGQGRGGGGNSPATQYTEGSSNTSCGEETESDQGPEADPST